MKIVNVAHALSASALTTTMPEAGHRDDQDEEDGDGGGDAGDRTDLGARDVGERPAASPRRGPQPEEVLDRAGQADAADQPDQARGVAELRGEHRTDERTGAGDRREVVAEQHPAAGGVVVRAVVLRMRRRDAASRRATMTFAAMNAL